MGFPIDKCRRALIETKNVSLEVALDYFLTMNDEESKRKSTSTTTIKGTWICIVCTLENSSSNTECEACCTPVSTPEQPPTKQELLLESIPEIEEEEAYQKPRV